jgi:hypothetical protein
LAASSPAADCVPKISRRQISTTSASISAANAATPIDTMTSNRLPVTAPVTSSPIAISTTERTMPNRITSELHSPD